MVVWTGRGAAGGRLVHTKATGLDVSADAIARRVCTLDCTCCRPRVPQRINRLGDVWTVEEPKLESVPLELLLGLTPRDVSVPEVIDHVLNLAEGKENRLLYGLGCVFLDHGHLP
jgi:hypothetical protein